MSTDDVLAGDRWAFDEQVAAVFDDMLARSIPAHDEMRRVTTAIAGAFIGDAGRIVDLGAARGEALAHLLAEHPSARAVAIEISEPMVRACRTALGERAEVMRLDLRHEWPDVHGVDVIMSVLTLQFVPIEYRHRVLDRCWCSLRTGGALVLVEKIIGASAQTDELLSAAYYARKRENGYSDEQITRKRLALEGVLVPLSASMNQQLLDDTGFRHVERIWQSLNFVGWLAIK